MAFELLWKILIYVAILVVSSIPLLIAVKLFGGRSSVVKVILVNVGIGIAIALIRNYLAGKIAGILIPIIIFLVLLLIYNVMFELGWIKSFFVWVLQFVIAYLLIWLVSLILPNFAATAKILLSPSFFN